MNKNKILAIILATVMTVVSISTVAFAKENVATNSNGVVTASDIGTKISDEKVEQIAKDAFLKYLGVDIEQKIKEKGLKPSIQSMGSSILVEYFPNATKTQQAANKDMINDNYSVVISQKDQSVQSVCGMDNIEEKEYAWDETKIKDAAAKYLKDKGLPTDVQDIKADDEKKSIGIVEARCEYADGSEVLLEFSAKDYSVIYYGYSDKPANGGHKPIASSITDEKAKQIAGDAFSKYLGVNIDQKIKDEDLETRVDRFDDEIIITFNEPLAKAQKDSDNKMMNGDFSVTISAKDGSVTSVCAIDNLEEKEYPFDEAKIKDAAAKYLKDKGLPTNVKSITADNEKQKIGLVAADCEYADGSKILLEFSAKDYSVVCNSMYYKSHVSDEKAEQIAKDAFSKYLGIDIEQKIKEKGLKPSIENIGTSTLITYFPDATKDQQTVDKNMINDNYSVTISDKDESVQSVCGMDNIEEKEYTWDEAKIKDAAAKYLKDKGLPTDVQDIKADDEKKSIGIVGAQCKYADGSEVLLEFSAKDYSVIYYGYINKPANGGHNPIASSITDEKAKQLAGDVLSKYLGVNIDEKIKDEELETRVDRFDDEILITFNESLAKAQKDGDNKMLNGDFSVTISAKDGSMTSVCGIDNLEEKEYPFDEAKIKDAAAKYLKDKGFPTDVQDIKADDEKKSIGLVGADCKYADGSTVLLELSAKDYSVVCVSVYGASK